MKNRVLLTVILLLLYCGSYGQITTQEEPTSFKTNIPVLTKSQTTMKSFDSLDMKKIEQEDQEDRVNGKLPRFGYSHEVNYNLENSGEWIILSNGDRIWRLMITCEGALSINLLYDKFYIPDSAKFFVYSNDRKQCIGAITSQNKKSDKDNIRGFATGLVLGNKITLEYYLPKYVKDTSIISVSCVVHGYLPIFSPSNTRDYGASGLCHINVNCIEGQNWQNEKNAVALMAMKDRTASGALMNTTTNDYKPLFLTANHNLYDVCYPPMTYVTYDAINRPYLDYCVFYWHYESQDCISMSNPSYVSTWGATVVANTCDPTGAAPCPNVNSDFALLELTQDPWDNNNITPYYLGWDCSGSQGPARGVGIHHPIGDIKKISTYTTYPFDAGYYNQYWGVVWNSGITEIGSSGSPLISWRHRVVGQLYGGNSNCDNPNGQDLYGKLSISWTNNGAMDDRRKLQPWLDPLGTGDVMLDGIGLPSISPNSAGVLFVKQGGAGRKYGYNWANALDGFAVALQLASTDTSIHEIWVANGTYYSTANTGFILPDNVKIYGGFPANADDVIHTSINTRPIGNSNFGGTILSGILGIHNNNHVVIANGNSHLDGFVITGGIAKGYGDDNINGVSIPRNQGGGIYVTGDADLHNLDIVNNWAGFGGGGMAIANGCPNLENIVIRHNIADSNGGGLYCEQANTHAKNFHIFGNWANQGGGIYFHDMMQSLDIMPVFENISIHDNYAPTGGGIFNNQSISIFLNALIYDNFGAVGGILYNNSPFMIFVHATITANDPLPLPPFKPLIAGDTIPLDPLGQPDTVLPYLGTSGTTTGIVTVPPIHAFNSIVCYNTMFAPPAPPLPPPPIIGGFNHLDFSGNCFHLFTNPLNGNFSPNISLLANHADLYDILQIQIPVIDTTLRLCPMPSDLLQTDIAGTPRINPMVSLGAYEYPSTNLNRSNPFQKSMPDNDEEEEEEPLVKKEFNGELQVYPNPTTGQLTINSGELAIKKIEIYDVVGQLLYQINKSTNNQINKEISIDVSHLAAGMYFLKVDNKVVKFVKE